MALGAWEAAVSGVLINLVGEKPIPNRILQVRRTEGGRRRRRGIRLVDAGEPNELARILVECTA